MGIFRLLLKERKLCFLFLKDCTDIPYVGYLFTCEESKKLEPHEFSICVYEERFRVAEEVVCESIDCADPTRNHILLSPARQDISQHCELTSKLVDQPYG